MTYKDKGCCESRPLCTEWSSEKRVMTVSVWCSVFQCVGSMLQGVAVRCNVLQSFDKRVMTVLLHPRNPPHRHTQSSQYLTVQIQSEILISVEFVPRNLSLGIWWISGV